MTEEKIIKMLNNFPQIEVVKYILTIQENEENLKNNLNQASELLIKKDNKIENLQTRINKAMEYIENEIKTQGLSMYVDTSNHLNKIKSILQDKEVENNE